MKNIFYFLAICLTLTTIGCDKDDDPIALPIVNIGMDQNVTYESIVTLDATAMDNFGISWTVLGPDGASVSLSDAQSINPTFTATQIGQYTTKVIATNAGGTKEATGTITVNNATYATQDQMGRPAINTVFNYFGSADTKNGYNMTLPSAGSANADGFKGIFDALQGYIGLDPDAFINILGIDNATTAGVLAVDVLGSDKSSASAYGSLNGRALSDDVVDVTLILTFLDQSGSPESIIAQPTIDGLDGDNVNGNDKDFLTTFPYLATAN